MTRTTKLSNAKATQFREKHYNIIKIKILLSFGASASKYPTKRSVNLSPNHLWTVVGHESDDNLFSNDGSIELRPEEIPEVSDILVVEEEEEIEETKFEATSNLTGVIIHFQVLNSYAGVEETETKFSDEGFEENISNIQGASALDLAKGNLQKNSCQRISMLNRIGENAE